MAVVARTKCGNCNTLWSRRVNQVRVNHGPPNVKCNNCGFINKTGMKWAKDMSKEDKRNLLLKTCLNQGVLWIFIIGLIFLFAGTGFNGIMGGLAFIAGGLLYAAYIDDQLKTSYKNEDEAVKVYEDNGEFVTSDYFVNLYDK